MKNCNVKSLTASEMRQINGGGVDEAYDTGYAIGKVIGQSVKNFLTLTGISKLLSIL